MVALSAISAFTKCSTADLTSLKSPGARRKITRHVTVGRLKRHEWLIVEATGSTFENNSTKRTIIPMVWRQWRKPGASDDDFSHRPGFSNFPWFYRSFSNFSSLFPDFPDLYFVKCRTQPFPHNKNTFFHISATKIHFLVIRQHYFSKYWVDECMGRPPPQTLGGPSPSPLGFRPCVTVIVLPPRKL